MGKCKDCKYWDQDFDALNFYNENFGECTHKKVIDRDYIKDNYNDKNNDRFNDYDVIYSADYAGQLKVNKEFYCKNFERK